MLLLSDLKFFQVQVTHSIQNIKTHQKIVYVSMHWRSAILLLSTWLLQLESHKIFRLTNVHTLKAQKEIEHLDIRMFIPFTESHDIDGTTCTAFIGSVPNTSIDMKLAFLLDQIGDIQTEIREMDSLNTIVFVSEEDFQIIKQNLPSNLHWVFVLITSGPLPWDYSSSGLESIPFGDYFYGEFFEAQVRSSNKYIELALGGELPLPSYTIVYLQLSNALPIFVPENLKMPIEVSNSLSKALNDSLTAIFHPSEHLWLNTETAYNAINDDKKRVTDIFVPYSPLENLEYSSLFQKDPSFVVLLQKLRSSYAKTKNKIISIEDTAATSQFCVYMDYPAVSIDLNPSSSLVSGKINQAYKPQSGATEPGKPRERNNNFSASPFSVKKNASSSNKNNFNSALTDRSIFHNPLEKRPSRLIWEDILHLASLGCVPLIITDDPHPPLRRSLPWKGIALFVSYSDSVVIERLAKWIPQATRISMRFRAVHAARILRSHAGYFELARREIDIAWQEVSLTDLSDGSAGGVSLPWETATVIGVRNDDPRATSPSNISKFGRTKSLDLRTCNNIHSTTCPSENNEFIRYHAVEDDAKRNWHQNLLHLLFDENIMRRFGQYGVGDYKMPHMRFGLLDWAVPSGVCGHIEPLGVGDGVKYICEPDFVTSYLSKRLKANVCQAWSLGSGGDATFEVAFVKRLPNCEMIVFDCYYLAANANSVDGRIRALPFCVVGWDKHNPPSAPKGEIDRLTIAELRDAPPLIDGMGRVRLPLGLAHSMVAETGRFVSSNSEHRQKRASSDAIPFENLAHFKIDIEGDEWGVLNDMLLATPPALPIQLEIEFHLPALGDGQGRKVRTIIDFAYMFDKLERSGMRLVQTTVAPWCIGRCLETLFVRQDFLDFVNDEKQQFVQKQELF